MSKEIKTLATIGIFYAIVAVISIKTIKKDRSKALDREYETLVKDYQL
jgi:hypothetical protein